MSRLGTADPSAHVSLHVSRPLGVACFGPKCRQGLPWQQQDSSSNTASQLALWTSTNAHHCLPPFTAPPRSLSKLIEESTRSSSVGGMLNPRWLAPEVLTGGSATAASDVFRWAFGVVKRMALMGVLQLAA